MTEELHSLAKDLLPINHEIGIKFDNPLVIRGKIDRFEELLKTLGDDQIKIKTTHRFAKGMYAREVFIPKGAIVIGRIHKHECFSFMLSGDKTVLTEDGVRRLTPPFTAVSRPGLKRVGFAHEDSVWTTVHATNERDIEKLEEALFAEKYSEADSSSEEELKFYSMEGFLCRL